MKTNSFYSDEFQKIKQKIILKLHSKLQHEDFPFLKVIMIINCVWLDECVMKCTLLIPYNLLIYYKIFFFLINKITVLSANTQT